MRFGILTKIAALFAIILSAALVAILFNTNRVFYDDKKAFVLEFSNQLSRSVAHLTDERVQAVREKMAIFASNYESLTPQQKKDPNLNEFLFSQYSQYLNVSTLELESGNNKIRWSITNKSSQANNWNHQYINNLLSKINLSKVADGKNYFLRLSQPDGNSAFAIIQSVNIIDENKSNVNEVLPEAKSNRKKIFIVGIFSKNLLMDLTNDYKASVNTVFIVDKKGFVFSHPNKKFLGVSLAEHPVVQEIVNSSKISGAGENYEDLENNEITASFSKLTDSNLYVVITTPKQEAFRAANELFKTLIIIGIGILLIGLIVTLVFSRLITDPLKRLKAVAAEIGKGNFEVPVSINSSDEVGELAGSIKQMATSLIERDNQIESQKTALVQSEKMSAFGQLSAGIAHEVKNPLAGILGHAQLAKAKVTNPDIMKHIDVIEKETRRSKDIIENLMKFARAEKLELMPTNIYDSVAAASDLVDHQLSLMGVKIFRHINQVPAVMANSNQIQQVLLNLMMNAGHAMENSENKELHVYLEHVADLVRIRIQDTGHGMPEEVRKKIFEPFFTTKPAGKGTGLGLSVSIGIVRDHNAQIYVESEEGVGTTFFIDFPVAQDVALPESRYENAEAEIGKETNETAPMPVEDENFIASSLLEEREDLSSEINNETNINENIENFIEESTKETSSLEQEKPILKTSNENIEMPIGLEGFVDSVESPQEENPFSAYVDNAPAFDSDADIDGFSPSNLQQAAEKMESYSAAEALGGFGDDEETKTVALVPPEKNTASSSSNMEESNKDNEQAFKVKIRRPKLKK